MSSVSVVVPTRNRAELLARTLRALAGQEGTPPMEVVVVDDGSTDGTRAVLSELGSRLPFPLTVVRHAAGRGPGPARNSGWRAAGGTLVCFTDDDCEPTPTWVARLSAALADADLAQGVTVPNPAERDRWGPFSHTVEVLAPTGFYETCNIGYRRHWLEDLGGFDESYGYYCEDTDLALRAISAGARARFVEDAVVHHAVGPSRLRSHLRALPRRAGLARLVRVHPEARALLARRWFHRPTHPPAIATAAALVVTALRPHSAPRWALLAASAGWYGRTCVATWKAPARARWWPAVVPRALVADLAEVAVLARASLEERTLVL